MKKTNRIFSFSALCVPGGAVYLTIALISPAALPIDTPATEFSAGRAMQDLGAISREPHPNGSSQAYAGVRDYLLGEIRPLGLEPQVQKTVGMRVAQSDFSLSGSIENILVRLPGTDTDGAILLVAPCLLLGSHNYSPMLIVVIALESILFIAIGLWRFSREEL